MWSCRMKRASLILVLVLTLSLFPLPTAQANPVSWLLGLEKAARLLEETGFFSKLLRAFDNDRSGGGMDPNGNRKPGSPPPSPPPGNHNHN